VVFSPGDALENNDDAVFSLSRFGATSDFSYFFADIERVIQLPDDFILELGGTLQLMRSQAHFNGADSRGRLSQRSWI